jgi:hypothetical protein
MRDAMPAGSNLVFKPAEIDIGAVAMPEFSLFGIGLSYVQHLFGMGIHPILKLHKHSDRAV